MNEVRYRRVQITCQEREALIESVGRSYNGPADPWVPISTLTDLSGEFGEPEVYTKWGHRDSEEPLLEDYLWPDSDRPCEHYRFEKAEA